MGLNILLSIELFYPQINGIITTSINMLKNLKEMGHNPAIITPRVVPDSPTEVDGIPVYYIPSTPTHVYPGLRMVNVNHPLFKKIVEEHKTDIIHTTAPWFITKGLNKVAKKKNIPSISTFHTNLHYKEYMQYIAPFLNKHTLKIVQYFVWHTTKQFLNPCDLLTAPSPYVCDDLRKVFPHKRVRWIINGLETEKFRQPTHPDLLDVIVPNFRKEKKQYAIFIGRLAKEKSIDVLLQGVAEIIDECKNFHLVIVGDGPKANELKRLCTVLNIETNVTFLGKLDHDILVKSGLIHYAKFFTTASTSETHSMTVTEALCCGIPVVVPDHKSMTYFTKNTSLYFEPMNPVSLGKSLKDMWSNEEVYMPLKENAKQMIDKFNGKRIAELYLEEYEKLLNQKNRNR